MPRRGSITIDDLPASLRQQALQQLHGSKKPAEPKPRQNKTEAAYSRYLEFEKAEGRVAWFGFEKLRLLIADGKRRAWFTPDFLVVLADGRVQLHETKGWWREASRVRIKVAASLYPMWQFVGVQRINGGWSYEGF